MRGQEPANTTDVEQDGKGDGCLGDFYRTNGFVATEKNLGAYDSVAECVASVKANCSDYYDVASVPYGSLPNGKVDSCWCQHSGGENLASLVNSYDAFAICQVKSEDTQTN